MYDKPPSLLSRISPFRVGSLLLLASIVACAACDKKKPGGSGGGESGPEDTTEYTLKASFPRVGVTVGHTHKSKMEMTGEILDNQGKRTKELNKRKLEHRIWKETTLAANADGEDDWTKLRVFFDRYEIDEHEDKPPERFKLAGIAILIERRENGVVFTDEECGLRVPESLTTELRKYYGPKGSPDSEQEFVPHRDILPDKPVRAGQSWDISGAKIAKSLGRSPVFEADPDKTVAKGKLIRAYEKDGHRFGVIEVDATLSTKGGKDVSMSANSKMNVRIQYDGCIDGSVCEVKATVKMDGVLEGKGPRGTFSVRFNANMELSESEETK